MNLGPVGNTIRQKLASTFAPVSLEVIDESHHHAGHAGSRPDGESHFRVRIVSEAFRGKSRVAQHRLVNEALADLLKSRVHALAIESASPPELTFADVQPDDPEFTGLLAQEKLGLEDLRAGKAQFMAIRDGGGKLLACGGIELAGPAALLRSIAVAPVARGRGLGQTITLKMLSLARNAGAREAYLLTNSAAEFFRQFGFAAVDRDAVPPAIAATAQFSGSCCSQAQAMRVSLAA